MKVFTIEFQHLYRLQYNYQLSTAIQLSTRQSSEIAQNILKLLLAKGLKSF